jgi:diacylglycerol kinase
MDNVLHPADAGGANNGQDPHPRDARVFDFDDTVERQDNPETATVSVNLRLTEANTGTVPVSNSRWAQDTEAMLKATSKVLATKKLPVDDKTNIIPLVTAVIVVLVEFPKLKGTLAGNIVLSNSVETTKGIELVNTAVDLVVDWFKEQVPENLRVASKAYIAARPKYDLGNQGPARIQVSEVLGAVCSQVAKWAKLMVEVAGRKQITSVEVSTFKDATKSLKSMTTVVERVFVEEMYSAMCRGNDVVVAEVYRSTVTELRSLCMAISSDHGFQSSVKLRFDETLMESQDMRDIAEMVRNTARKVAKAEGVALPSEQPPQRSAMTAARTGRSQTQTERSPRRWRNKTCGCCAATAPTGHSTQWCPN